MKIKCNECSNEDWQKFAPCKKGVICLNCYETNITKTPENELERVQLAIEVHLGKSQGGSTRKFTKAYRAMKNHLIMLQNLEEGVVNQEYLKGYQKCVDIFEGSTR